MVAVSATPPTAITASTGAPLQPLRKTLALFAGKGLRERAADGALV
jgi:hypothetical protein